MKKIEAIIKPFKVDGVREALREAEVTAAVYVSDYKGFQDRKHPHIEMFRGAEYVLDYLPKAKIEITVEDGLAEKAVDAILNAAHTGRIGDGQISVTRVDEVIDIQAKRPSGGTTAVAKGSAAAPLFN